MSQTTPMTGFDHRAFRIGDWRVDPAIDEISRGGKTIKLEPRTMRVLGCLAEHAGQVVTVDQLLDTVWKDVVVTPDSVYQAVAALRKALGDDTKEPVYIANVVPWRPPGNRTPTPQETAACRPFIARQIELADPDFLVCLGAPAAAELMNNTQGILKFRGQWRDFDTGTRTIRAMATLHPAYLLRQPLQKRLAWRDFLLLKEALDG